MKAMSILPFFINETHFIGYSIWYTYISHSNYN